jgi:hypothetical protein
MNINAYHIYEACSLQDAIQIDISYDYLEASHNWTKYETLVSRYINNSAKHYPIINRDGRKTQPPSQISMDFSNTDILFAGFLDMNVLFTGAIKNYLSLK